MTIRIIKILSVILLTASAVVGLLFDVKEDGHLNDWGKIALLIIIFSSITASLTEFLEHKKDVLEDKLEEARENERKAILSQIKENIISTNLPLVPFRLFYTLKHTASDKQIEDFFKEVQGYKSVMKTEYLRLIGTSFLSETPFNEEYLNPLESYCSVKDSKLIDPCIKGNGVVKIPCSICIEIFTDGSSLKPEIVIETNSATAPTEGTVKEIRLYDKNIYQDTIVPSWKIKTDQSKVFGVRDLLNAKIKVTATFYITDRKYDNEFPRLTNLLLYFGDNPTSLLSFNLDQLCSNQKSFRENPEDSFIKFENELAREFFQPLIVAFEITINDEIYNNQIRQFAS